MSEQPTTEGKVTRQVTIKATGTAADMENFLVGIANAVDALYMEYSALRELSYDFRLPDEPDGRLAKAAELLREVRAYDSHRDNTLACEFTAEGWIEERDEWLASLSTTKGAGQ